MTYFVVVAREEFKEEDVLLYQGDYSLEELKQMAEETGDSSLLTELNIHIIEVREQPTAALLMDTVNNWLQEIGES